MLYWPPTGSAARRIAAPEGCRRGWVLDRLLSLDRLVVFHLVAKHGSFTRAAEELHVTQPAVTKRIEALERDCGCKLFERRPGNLSLTAGGEALLAPAAAAFQAATEATQAIRSLTGNPAAGLLRLSAPQTWSSFIMRNWIPRLLARYPDMRIEIKRGNYEDMLRNLAEGRTEAALLPMGAEDARFQSLPLPIKPEPLVVLVPPEHALAGCAELQVADLAGYPVVLRAHMPFRKLLDERAGAAGVHLDVVAEVSSSEDVRQSVLAGSGVGVLPEIGGQPEVAEGLLRAVRLEGGELLVTCHLVTVAGAPRSAALDCFVQSLGLFSAPPHSPSAGRGPIKLLR